MAITYFRISTLPALVVLNKNAVPVTLNQSYLIAEENELTLDNGSGYKGEFLDSFGFQVSEDDAIWSNEGIYRIKELVNTNTQESANDVLAASENSNYNIETEALLPINTSTDRIKITNITGYGTPKYNGSALNIGDEIFWHNFGLLTFDTMDGGGLPYAVISYQCGNHLGYNTGTTYTITINVSSLGEISFVSGYVTNDVDPSFPTYNRVTNVDSYEITKGFIGKQAKINVTIASPMFSDSANNKVLIKYNGITVTKTANETFDVFATIDNNGKVDVNIEHLFIDVKGSTTSSVVTMVVTEIDGSPSNVSGTDTVVSTANFVGSGAGGGITDYRSSYEADGFVYSGWNNGGTPNIRRTKDAVTTNATGLTDLETDWTNRLSLTYV